MAEQPIFLLLSKVVKITEIFINKKPVFADYEDIYQLSELILKGVVNQEVQKHILLVIQILFINFNSNLYFLF